MNTPFPAHAYGITSTIPLEIPLAAGATVLDLNNRFVASAQAGALVRRAETDGYPRTCCAWIRGLYGLIRELPVKRVIFVTGGDCSNTHAMMETLLPGLEEAKTFNYPLEHDPSALHHELERFARAFGVDLGRAEQIARDLQPIRNDLRLLDQLTYETGQVSGGENHQWLVSASDFQGDVPLFGRRLAEFLDEVRRRTPRRRGLRLGLIGVPPIMTDLHACLEETGAWIVLNEIPRQFALYEPADDLTTRYSRYTYPYGAGRRIEDLKIQAEARNIDAFIHYTQAFCHRQIHDILMRQELGRPILTLEGEAPGPCDARTRLRLESFLEILQERPSAT
jgi:benzoyl-CoA reductase/2-hydroxyglutaryl-CoA dehydratase subunit BcrC/BadD/HgdB